MEASITIAMNVITRPTKNVTLKLIKTLSAAQISKPVQSELAKLNARNRHIVFQKVILIRKKREKLKSRSFLTT